MRFLDLALRRRLGIGGRTREGSAAPTRTGQFVLHQRFGVE
jgi:hypothetical protein